MTASAALLPIAATTAACLVREMGDVLKQGMSFVDTLRAPAATATDPAEAARDADAAPELTADSRRVRWKTAWQNIHAQTAALHQILIEQFRENGVDLSESVVLSADADGRVLVATGHPDRAAIEQVLDSNPGLTSQLRQLFQQVASLHSPSGDDAHPDVTDIRLLVDRHHAHHFQAQANL